MASLQEHVAAKGRLLIELRDSEGELKEVREVDNVITCVGDAHVADRMSDAGEAAMSHMAIGTGTTAASASDTALVGELDRNALTSTTQGTGGDDNDVIYVGMEIAHAKLPKFGRNLHETMPSQAPRGEGVTSGRGAPIVGEGAL